MNIPLHTLRVKKSALADRHRVWIFSNEVEHLAKTVLGSDASVALVQLEGSRRFGLYDRTHLISVRLFSEAFSNDLLAKRSEASKANEIDAVQFQDCLAEHLKRIKELKSNLGFNDGKNAYRFAHGDADGLPSIILDDYQSVLVLQSGSRAGEWLYSHVCEALKKADDRPLYERSTGQSRQMEGLGERNKWLVPNATGETVKEVFHADMLMSFNLQRAQKTGLFLDQRANLTWLGDFLSAKPSHAKAKSILDICSYAGAWSAKAAQSGARSCVLIDQDSQALTMAEANIKKQNALAEIKSLQGDMFDHLATLANKNEIFDVVVADPPAFAKSAKHLPEARRAYARLVKQSSRLVKHNGLYVVCSCSRNMEEDEFFDLVSKNLDNRFRWQLVFKGSQSPDHTMLSNDKHSRYLKVFAFVNTSQGAV